MAPPFRVLPSIDGENEFFWTSGADGVLRFLCCEGCGYYLHPPVPQCPQCLSRNVSPRAVSGLGEIHSFTVNHQPWDGDPAPYAIVLVELAEQQGLRLTSNLVGTALDEIRIGMPVQVQFEQHGEIWLPVFTAVTP
jgi:uncharacterized OB-fold protein